MNTTLSMTYINNIYYIDTSVLLENTPLLKFIRNLNPALRKNFLFNSHPDFNFCGLFLFPGPLGGLETVSRDGSDIPIQLEAFKTIFVFRPKIDFFPRAKSTVFGQK